MVSYLLIFGVFMILSWIVSYMLKSKFKKYSQIPMNNGITGSDVAERMLKENGIYDVKIISVEGDLTDHYNPTNKTINLSREVYYGKHISAGAVSAHECGHAIQHANTYAWLTIRSSLVPVVSIASNWIQWVLLAGVLLINVFPQLLLVGIAIFGITTIFSFITLPVEINASNRAITWLIGSGVTSYEVIPKAQDALRWAAYTYVVAVLGSLATLLYYIMVYIGRR